MRARPTRFSDSTGLRLCGMAEEPFCPSEKNSSASRHFGALQMADFRRQPLDRRGDDAERREIHGVAVARDDLRRDRLDGEPHLLRHMGFDARIDLREGADGAGNRAGRDLGARRLRAALWRGRTRHRPRASFSPNVVGSAWMPWERPMVGVSLYSPRAALERLEQRIDVGDEQIGGAHELNIEAGVEHVRDWSCPDARNAPPVRRFRPDG